jgi:hypothetical protein
MRLLRTDVTEPGNNVLLQLHYAWQVRVTGIHKFTLHCPALLKYTEGNLAVFE